MFLVLFIINDPHLKGLTADMHTHTHTHTQRDKYTQVIRNSGGGFEVSHQLLRQVT